MRSEPEDIPKSLGKPDERAARMSRLGEAHVRTLTTFVETIRAETGFGAKIPYFDPVDGGILAKCLFLLEAPGRRAVASGFVSRNNPDETARNFFLLNREAGVPRTATVIWNIVPWYIGSNSRIRAARQGDIRTGLTYLHRLLELLPRVKMIALFRKKAQNVDGFLRHRYPELTIVTSPHPSPLYVNRKRANRNAILTQLRSVAHHMG